MEAALAILGTVFLGLSVAVFAYAGAELYRRGFDFVERDFRDKLRRLRRSTNRLRVWLLSWVIFVAAVFLVLWIALDVFVLGVAIVMLLLALPWYLVRRMAEKRRQKIEDQLADAMVALASAIKAGLSLAQAMEILAQQTPLPICQEFQQMHGEYQLGKPMEECLVEAKQRLRSENFALFAAAMEASRESGGRLNETVDRIAHSVRELQRLERKVQSETAQARSSAFYMALAPVAILAMYYFVIDPQNTERLFRTVPGQIMLCAALLLNVVAYLWARKILNPDI
ncbi:MAG: type II secretion system F family protein [Planctomycetaceae bacterium]